MAWGTLWKTQHRMYSVYNQMHYAYTREEGNAWGGKRVRRETRGEGKKRLFSSSSMMLYNILDNIVVSSIIISIDSFNETIYYNDTYRFLSFTKGFKTRRRRRSYGYVNTHPYSSRILERYYLYLYGSSDWFYPSFRGTMLKGSTSKRAGHETWQIFNDTLLVSQ